MENCNSSERFNHSRFPFPWPPYNPFPFPYPDPFPPYLLSVMQSVGSMHNELLDNYVLRFPTLDTPHDETWNFMITDTTRLLGQSGVSGTSYPAFKTADNHTTHLIANTERYIRQLVKAGDMTPLVGDQTIIILDIVRNTASADVNARLTAYANRIAFRVDISADEKIVLIGAAYTAIATNIFWNYALSNDTSPYHKIAVNLNTGGNLFKIKWADIGGFVVGAVVGTVVGGPVVGISSGIALGGFASKVFGEEK